MSLIRFKNQCDYALKTWLDNWPTSGHPLDERRFMVFAKSVAKYRNKKWLSFKNFEKALTTSPHHFTDDEIEKYYYKLLSFVEFYKTPPIPSVEIGEGGDYGYYQRGVRNGKRYVVSISQEEYFKGASKDTLMMVEYLDD